MPSPQLEHLLKQVKAMPVPEAAKRCNVGLRIDVVWCDDDGTPESPMKSHNIDCNWTNTNAGHLLAIQMSLVEALSTLNEFAQARLEPPE